MNRAQQNKDIFELSDEEFAAIGDNPNQSDQIRSMLVDGINEMRYEINRMEKFLDTFLIRGGALMTVGGLISLLPLGINNNSDLFIKHYLIWILPLLLVAIFAFIKSSEGAHTYRTHFNSYSRGATEELLGLRAIAKSTLQIWRELYKKYQRTLHWHKINSIAIFLFLFWYIVNFYLFAFTELADRERMIESSLLLLLVAILIYSRSILASYSKSWTKEGEVVKRGTGNS